MALYGGGIVYRSRREKKEKLLFESCCPPVQHCIILCSSTFLYRYPFSFFFSLVIIFLYPLHGMTAWIILLLPPLCNTCGRLPCSLHASTRYTDLYIIIHWAPLWANQRSFAPIIILLRPLYIGPRTETTRFVDFFRWVFNCVLRPACTHSGLYTLFDFSFSFVTLIGAGVVENRPEFYA